MTRWLALLACLVALLLVPRPSAAGHLMLSANEQELAMCGVTPTALEDTGVRIEIKGHPASLRVAPQ